MDWHLITPNSSGDWINQRGDVFTGYSPLSESGTRPGIFLTSSLGVSTNRDAWAYGYSEQVVLDNMRDLIDDYETQRRTIVPSLDVSNAAARKARVGQLVKRDPTRISWSDGLLNSIARNREISFDASKLRSAMYRPFSRQKLYLDDLLTERPGRTARQLGVSGQDNVALCVMRPNDRTPFAVLAVELPPNLALFMDAAQCYFRWSYQHERDVDTQQVLGEDQAQRQGDTWRRMDNISDSSLCDYRSAYGLHVSGDDVFAYVYGLLHSADYRRAFTDDLKKTLPHIPRVPSVDDFEAFVQAGRTLMNLHTGYEAVDLYPLTVTGDEPSALSERDPYERFRVEKMRWGGGGNNKDRSTIKYNSRITLSGIPEAAHEYRLGSRSAIEWVLDRYQVKVDKASGLVNDPNDWSRDVGEPRYILSLLQRIVTVSVETVSIVSALPEIDVELLT